MRYLSAIVFAVLFVAPLQATTINFSVDPAQTGTVFTGDAWPTGSLYLHSSDLNGTVLTGQSLSLDAVLNDDVLARIFALDVGRLGILLEIQATGIGDPGVSGGATGYLLDNQGTQIGRTKDAGSGQVFYGSILLGLVQFDRAELGGAQVIEIGGVHFDTGPTGTGYTITDASLLFSFYGNRIEFGTPAQLPESSSLALLPFGLIGIVTAGKFRKRMGGGMQAGNL